MASQRTLSECEGALGSTFYNYSFAQNYLCASGKTQNDYPTSYDYQISYIRNNSYIYYSLKSQKMMEFAGGKNLIRLAKIPKKFPPPPFDCSSAYSHKSMVAKLVMMKLVEFCGTLLVKLSPNTTIFPNIVKLESRAAMTQYKSGGSVDAHTPFEAMG